MTDKVYYAQGKVFRFTGELREPRTGDWVLLHTGDGNFLFYPHPGHEFEWYRGEYDGHAMFMEAATFPFKHDRFIFEEVIEESK